MKYETYTYTASSIQDGASVPTILGRPNGHGKAMSSPLSAAFLRFWMWLRLQMTGHTTQRKDSKAPVSGPQHIFKLPSDNPAIPQFGLRVNRSIMRKMRRLQRIDQAAISGRGLPKPDGIKDMSNTQYAEYCIRVYGWSRIRVFRLGGSRRLSLRRVLIALALQGQAVSLRKAELCKAPLSPD